MLVDMQIDPFAQGLIDQGAEVEEWAQKRFPDGVHVRAFNETAVEITQRLIAEGKHTIYQATFSDGELYAMIDILQWNELYQAWDIIEVKSSSDSDWKKKGKISNEHLDDTGFQMHLLQKLGMRIANVYLCLLNSDYIKEGGIDVHQLFTQIEITDKLKDLEAALTNEINDAWKYIQVFEEPTSCLCRYKSRKNHCGAFPYLYPDTPDDAVYDLHAIGNSKRLLADMVNANILDIKDVVDVTEFKTMKLWQWQTYIDDEEIIDPTGIQKELEALQYPLYFLDYETLPMAIPKYNGTGPHQQVVFQYSLHIIESKGAIPTHKEYLHTTSQPPMQSVAERLRNDIGDTGSVIAWYAPFERSRTQELAASVSEHRDFLIALTRRIYDLMDVVSNGYYHHKDFRGSASIKAVLPVMCPELSYKALNIQDGTQALTTFRDLIFTDKYKGREEQVIDDLLEYCKLDTWAMVRIWEEMWKKVK